MASLPPLERGLKVLEMAASSANGFTWKQACDLLGPVSTATVARLLKVLVEQGYLMQDGNFYKTGVAIQKLYPITNVNWILKNHGKHIAEKFSSLLQESCVISAYDGQVFEFVGVKIVEGSIGYGSMGYKIYPTVGHVFTQVSHAYTHPQEIKSPFQGGDINYGFQGKRPSWKLYAKSIVTGIKTGHFIELGWRRGTVYRTGIPVFGEDGFMVGAFMCGYHIEETLYQNLDFIMENYFKALDRIDGYRSLFQNGLEKMKKNLKHWEHEA